MARHSYGGLSNISSYAKNTRIDSQACRPKHAVAAFAVFVGICIFMSLKPLQLFLLAIYFTIPIHRFTVLLLRTF